LNEDVKRITALMFRTSSDNVLRLADEVIIDLTSEDLISRLKEGKFTRKIKFKRR
jgi:K+-sensing histidine kinase KdpD